ncbi:MAG TPA: DUF748 domain-containing protein [Candidatus Binatia bacterium]|nr:DUF748 domain-containing protein [Candidatus Binatia bacterium]
MALDIDHLRDQAARIARHPRSRKIAVWLASIWVAIGVLLGLVAPPLIRGKLAASLSERLHRQVTIEQLRINPYAMTVTVRGFVVKEAQGQAVAISFDELFINLELRSLFRLAPVIKELRLIKPYIHLVRNEDRTYNFQDLLAGPKSEGSGPPPRFALQNIQIVDGRVDFDDRPENTQHQITAVQVGIPFISSLPSYADLYVKPSFSAVVNGASLRLLGETKPFKDSHESTIGFSIDKLGIPKYLEYSPVALNFKVLSGELEGKLTASFRTAKNAPAVLSVSGNLGLENLEVQQSSGAPLLKLPVFEAVIDEIGVFAKKASVRSVKAQGIELHVARSRDGAVNLANLVGAPANAESSAAKAGQSESQPFHYTVGEVSLDSATIHFQDDAAARPYRTRLENLTAKMTGLTNEPEKKANVEFSFETDGKEKFSHSATLQLAPLAVEGKLDIQGLRPGALQPYYQNALAAEVKDGVLDVSTQYSYQKKGEAGELKLAGLNALLKSFRLELAGQPEPLWRIGSLAIKDTSVDLTNKSVVIGAIEARDGVHYIQRAKDGTVNYARIAKKAEPAPVAAPTAEAQTDSPWSIEAKEIAIDRFRFNWDDRASPAPAKLAISDLSLRAQHVANAKNRAGKAVLQARVNGAGALRLSGPVSISPIRARLAVEAKDIDVVPLQSYLADDFNFVLTGGRAGTKGELTIDGGGPGPLKMTYAGAAEVADFGSLEKTSSQDLLKWKSLALDGLQLATQPFGLRIAEITLSDFYSRLIIHPDGKTNLQTLRNSGTHGKERAAEDAVAEQKAPLPEPPSPKASPSEPAPEAERRAVTIGKVNLKGGNINFSDFFIKPNYSANLTDVEGAISELKPEAPGDLDLKGQLDYAAPVQIKGKINPLSKELFLDIIADAREIELNPFTPYSGKYVGYGIEKGKLSFNVKYHLENRKLSGQNKIILNQLTFGEKIESPTATKLPVLLAVALLKDRNGVIDVDLPISGSLDDPQFSVGGIVLRIIINLITRAVTAPFTLIASVFGGGGTSGEELSYIEFAPGRSNLDQPDLAKIVTLARALNNRPALNLEITGRFDPLTDLDGLKRVGIERKVKAQKMKDLLRRGQAPRSLDEVQIDANEYAKYLKEAYGEETFPKPRNVIGLARDLPGPEMEKLMIQYAKVGDDDLRRLADERAQAVRNALLKTGQVGAERLFVVASKGFTAEERASLKGRANRVDFSMR